MTALVRRIVSMPPRELRFRTACELRKAAGRVRTAVFTPRWDRARLLGSLSGEIPGSAAWAAARLALSRHEYAAAEKALARHFAQRTSAFPLNAVDLPRIADAIVQHFPESRADAVRKASSICEGRYDLLGFRNLAFGRLPSWHEDPVTRRQSPLVFWDSVPFLDSALGDHKIIWELNRHQHWLTLGRAHVLSKDVRFYDRFKAELRSWLSANPPLIGINWASMLELGFRALSWLWALELFVPSANDRDDEEPWIADLLLALDRQLTHVEQNLSHYFSPNTHLTGEALALYLSGLALPELKASRRRAALGREVLLQEASRQVRPDGGHVELSLHYQRYSTDFYLLAALVARRAGDPASAAFEDAARRQVGFLRSLTDIHGIRPSIGDDDGGQLLPLCGRDAADCRDTFAAAAVILGDPALAIGEIPEETYWLCGPLAGTIRAAARPWTSAALAQSGYFASRTTNGDLLVFDAGPHGYLNSGHAHADALACVLSRAGRPVLIDPGTATYTMDARLRDQFRSSAMHNTVVLDGRSQSIPAGPFHWRTVVDARATLWRSSSQCDYVEGTHDGYAPRRHTRAVFAIHGVGWWILDRLLGTGPAEIDSYWHVHPSWEIACDGAHVAQLRLGPSDRLAIASTAPLLLLAGGTDPLAVWSPAYGALEPAPVLVARRAESLPVTIATFVPANASLCDRLTIGVLPLELEPHGGWRGSAFAVRWRQGRMVVLSAMEDDGEAADEMAAPPGLWGTAELVTDARVAAIIQADQRAEVILVNGSIAETRSTPRRRVHLPSRVPLLRMPLEAVASSVHDVAAALER